MNSSDKIFLASTSPRRIELLRQFGFKKIQIIDPQLDENKIKQNIPIQKLVVALSYFKAESALRKLKKFNGFIISGDTEVYRCKKKFSKAISANQVKEYLSKLSGRKHFVYGGITIISSKGQVLKKFVKTEVFFNSISENELDDKNLLEEGVGKAGGYAIQGLASKFVKKIKGSYTNVVGLSLSDLYLMLKGIGFKN